MYDFAVLWNAGQSSDPYQVAKFFYPPAFVPFVMLLGKLPFAWAAVFFTLLSVAAMFALYRRQAWKWFLFLPTIHVLVVGQVDILFLYVNSKVSSSWGGVLAAAIMTLKPQLAIILLPHQFYRWWKEDKRAFARFAVMMGALWGFQVLWQPTWIGEWISNLRHSPQSSLLTGADLWALGTWLVLPIALGLAVWGMQQKREVSIPALQLASPFGFFYDTVVLIECAPAWFLITLSWLVAALTLVVPIPFSFLLPLGTLLYTIRHRITFKIIPAIKRLFKKPATDAGISPR
jgi:hypothetical protein